MHERLRETIARYRMMEASDLVLVAVSGGVDSMTLLTLLDELQGELGITLAVAHLDHRMRSGSADDAQFVVHHARSLGLPVIQRAIDVPSYRRKERRSPEEAARRVRYRFFQEAAREIEANVVALGHTLDDRVETFFINLLRGAGVAGLAGMPPVRFDGDLRYVRPLIECTREEIERYAQERGLPYREDPTNRDLNYLRNRVRHRLLPLLLEFNPNVLGTVARASEALRKTHEYLSEEAERAFQSALLSECPDEVVLDAREVRSRPEPLRSDVIRAALRRVKGDLQGIEAVHVEDVLAELEKGRSGNEVAFPEGIRAVYQDERLIITRRPAKPRRAPYCLPLHPGENRLAEIGWRFDLDILEGSHPIPEDRLEARIDYATIVEPLVVRNRQEGDRFEPLGLGGAKKLQDFFVDEKIPREERDETPILCDQGGILWVVGRRRSERARVTLQTQHTLRVRAKRSNARPKAESESGA